ncbi:MAG: flagellar biosynthesis anti-sigma factor FlgM [Pseudomonadota bacterium]
MNGISTKLDGISAVVSTATRDALTGAAVKPAAKPSPPAPSAIELSALAVEALRSDAPVDSARVEAIRTAIAEGRYPVEPGDIAKAMIRMEFGDDAG